MHKRNGYIKMSLCALIAVIAFGAGFAPAIEHLVFESVKGDPAVREIKGLKKNALDAKLATHDYTKRKLIYSNTFDDEKSLDDWVVEGPGEISIEDGQLRIQSKYAAATQKYIKQGGSDVRPYVENLMIRDLGKERIKESYLDGKFQDAHFVCWNKFETQANYILECDFKSIANFPLHMIMFSHIGLNGESVFDPALKPRNGIAAQYTRSDMKGYRISFFHPDRATSNLRKSPEKNVVAQGDDPTDQHPEETHKLRITKIANKVLWEIDNIESFTYVENDSQKVLQGGYFAIRLMNPAMGLYDNFKIYEIKGDL